MADRTRSVLLVVETDGGEIRPTSRELFGVGRDLADASGTSLAAVVIGSGVAVAGQSAAALGADHVLLADALELAQFTVGAYTRALEQAIASAGPWCVLLPGSTSGRDLAPYVATRSGGPCLVDCLRLSVDGDDVVATRPVYQGKLLTDIRAKRDATVFATIRTGAFAAPEPKAGRAAETTALELAFAPGDLRVTVTGTAEAPPGPTNLEQAMTVVVGGRGLGEADKFSLVEDLADALGGAVGATRAVTDLGWRPHYEQVGQTGKTVSPELYVGLAVSGAVQHTVGMRGSGTIVAVNRDAAAPIFKLADFGIVGDVFEIEPRLAARIRALRGE